MLTPAFQRGIRALKAMDYTYDLLIFPDQLEFCYQLVKKNPDQSFIIDHLAKPDIKNKRLDSWKTALHHLAQHPNVYCKLSGMVTEADWQHWKPEDLVPYIDVAVEAFGTNRLVFGSDWPVCQVAATYGQVIKVIREYFAAFSKEEQSKVFGKNAIQFYQLY